MKQTLFHAGILAAALALLPACDRPSDPAAQLQPIGQQGSPWTTPAEPVTADPDTAARWTAVDAALDAWTPMLEDAAGDAQDGKAEHDLKRVLLVMTEDDVLVRFELGAAPAAGDKADMRFWLEQGKQFLTVDTKRASPTRECTLSEVGTDVQYHIHECHRVVDNVVDIALPRKEMPAHIDLTKEFWISGPQVCCKDADRTEPIDRLDASQVVWRAPAEEPAEQPAEQLAVQPAEQPAKQ